MNSWKVDILTSFVFYVDGVRVYWSIITSHNQKPRAVQLQAQMLDFSKPLFVLVLYYEFIVMKYFLINYLTW